MLIHLLYILESNSMRDTSFPGKGSLSQHLACLIKQVRQHVIRRQANVVWRTAAGVGLARWDLSQNSWNKAHVIPVSITSTCLQRLLVLQHWRSLRTWIVGWCVLWKWFRWVLHRRMRRAQQYRCYSSRFCRNPKNAADFESFKYLQLFFPEPHESLKRWGWLNERSNRACAGSKAILLNTFGSEDRLNKHLYASPKPQPYFGIG